ncbi:hypothetical protein F0Z19_0253 [Vibrio cyclitrophicus]|nr:hypothetical protein M565_ctg5P1276 [Vibrio cyclitrophicus FF75]KAA8602720.1 hypothetical protein F0Z19_0253 [Vibrio cyclitrophicus]
MRNAVISLTLCQFVGRGTISILPKQSMKFSRQDIGEFGVLERS